MDAAVVGKSPRRVEFVSELGAAVEHARVPDSRRIAGGPGGGTVEAGIPVPLDLVADFDRDRSGRKEIAARPDAHVESLGIGCLGEKKGKRTSEDGETNG